MYKQNIYLNIISFTFLLSTLCLLSFNSSLWAADVSPPSNPVKLIFIHHSTGENWLDDDNGGLGKALMNSNYFVSDTNYGWGPESIGDLTDIGHWYLWFNGPSSSHYLDELYKESEQYSYYSRMSEDPGGENTIIMFKSCFPNSNIMGDPSESPVVGENPLRGEDAWSEYMTVENARGIYLDLLDYFASRQDKLFVLITPPPLSSSETDSTMSANARALNNWLVNEWLNDYQYENVAVFDFYNVLTSNGGSSEINDAGETTGNHHRWSEGAPQHIQTVDSDTSAYPSDSYDSHPSRAGNLKATAEFVPLLNWFYNKWKSAPCEQPLPDIKANGSDTKVLLLENEPLSVTISFPSGCYSGQQGELWLLASTDLGWFYCDMSDSIAWAQGIGHAYQGMLESMTSKTVLATPFLPPGNFIIYFGTDLAPNGSVDLETLLYDSVEIEVKEME